MTGSAHGSVGRRLDGAVQLEATDNAGRFVRSTALRGCPFGGLHRLLSTLPMWRVRIQSIRAIECSRIYFYFSRVFYATTTCGGLLGSCFCLSVVLFAVVCDCV